MVFKIPKCSRVFVLCVVSVCEPHREREIMFGFFPPTSDQGQAPQGQAQGNNGSMFIPMNPQGFNFGNGAFGNSSGNNNNNGGNNGGRRRQGNNRTNNNNNNNGGNNGGNKRLGTIETSLEKITDFMTSEVEAREAAKARAAQEEALRKAEEFQMKQLESLKEGMATAVSEANKASETRHNQALEALARRIAPAAVESPSNMAGALHTPRGRRLEDRFARVVHSGSSSRVNPSPSPFFQDSDEEEEDDAGRSVIENTLFAPDSDEEPEQPSRKKPKAAAKKAARAGSSSRIAAPPKYKNLSPESFAIFLCKKLNKKAVDTVLKAVGLHGEVNSKDITYGNFTVKKFAATLDVEEYGKRGHWCKMYTSVTGGGVAEINWSRRELIARCMAPPLQFC